VKSITTSPKKNKISYLTKINISLKESLGPHAFRWHKLLGKGSFGEVYLASRKSDEELFAIKVLNKEKVFAKNLTRYAMTEKNVLSVMSKLLKYIFKIIRSLSAYMLHSKITQSYS
jgi:serine/threonine protein kinase